MKRYGYIIKEIITDENLYKAVHQVVRGKKRKKSRDGRKILKREDAVVRLLRIKIGNGTFVTPKFKEKDIKERNKWRRIQVFPYMSRIGESAVMEVVDKYLKKRYIRTTASSIKGRGMQDLENQIRRAINQDHAGTRYAYQFDIRKFYDNANPDIIMQYYRRIFKDEVLLTMMDRFVHSLKKGISIGKRSSQGSANMMLSVAIDHYIKDRLGVKHFFRYCDDGLILCATKAEAWRLRNVIHSLTTDNGLEIKANERIFPITEGIDMLGFVTRSEKNVMMRKSTKQSFARKLHRVKSKKRRNVLVSSLYGIAKHSNSKNLFYKLTGVKMKTFKELGIRAYDIGNGKRMFDGKKVRISSLTNLTVEVLDFEADVPTANGPRTVVQVKSKGEICKFFTASKEMTAQLEQVREMKEFPFQATIVEDNFDEGKRKYKFE